MNKNTFLASLFGVAFIAALLLVAPQSHAAMQTFEKEYTYTASELDSKSSCRAIALEQVKRILLQELGVYVESVFSDKSSSDGRTKDEVRREITTLSAGVASTEVVEEKWDGTTYWLKARLKADPDDVAIKVEALRRDKETVAALEQSQKRASELSEELGRLRKELSDTKDAAAKAEQSRKYNITAQKLSATDWFVRGKTFASANQHQQAVEAYSKGVELDPQEPWGYIGRGTSNYKLEDYKKSIEDFNNVLNLRSRDKDLISSFWAIYGMRGRSYAKLGDHERAMEDYNKAIKLKPKEAENYVLRGVTYDALGEHKLALKDFSKAITLDPKYVMAYWSRGSEYAVLDKVQLAIEDFSKAIELDPKNGTAYGLRGLAYVGIGDNKRGIEDLNKAIELDPQNKIAYEKERERAKSKLGGINPASENKHIESSNRSIEQNSQDSLNYFLSGNQHSNQGKYNEAIEDFSKAIELEPRNANYYSIRGRTYSQLGDYQNAISDLTMAIKLKPAAAEYFSRGWAYFKLGDYQRTIEDCDKAIMLPPEVGLFGIPESGGIYYFLRGNANLSLGNKNQAIDDFKVGARLGDTSSQHILKNNGYSW